MRRTALCPICDKVLPIGERDVFPDHSPQRGTEAWRLRDGCEASLWLVEDYEWVFA